MLRPYKTKALDGASREAKTDLYLLLNFRKSFRREDAYGRVFEQVIPTTPTSKANLLIGSMESTMAGRGLSN